ncbi:sulfite exporter TauE/SafE family protein [Pararcticibacter amylolyticus]|nr:TSUP family transporter [Pararcticibacter amylolyticus]
MDTVYLDKDILTNEGLKILVVGRSTEAARVISSLHKRNKRVNTHVLKQAGEQADLHFEGSPVPVDAVHEDMTPDLITAYDLILIRSPGTSFTREVIRLARENGVLVSVLDAEDRGKNVARFNAGERYWKKIASRCLFALGFILTGSVIASYYPLGNLLTAIETFGKSLDLDATFGVMLLAGFVAQMVDGALGMGYGVISTTMLLSTGLNPAAISGSIHTAEMFSSGASGFSHYRFGNINKKLFRTLLLPGVIGAIAGALLLSYLGEQYGSWMRPVLSVYTLLLGLRILRNAFKKKNESRKVKHAGWLAGAGGFLDSFGGGGWGPLVTSTLISKGKTPRYIIGTVSLTEFFVTLGSALTFFVMLGTSHIETIAGLIIGGLLAAPIAARLAGKLKTKTMLIAVGVLVIISSLRIIIKAF